jgi:hypothetical protein
MAYDPNWLMKERAKNWARQEREMSHILDENQVKAGAHHPSAICGKGWGAKGHPSITTVMFPSVNNLPGCRQCREKFLTSIGVPFNETGYPFKYEVQLNGRTYSWPILEDAMKFTVQWDAMPLFKFNSI